MGSVDQGQTGEVHIIPGKVLVGNTSGAQGTIINYTQGGSNSYDTITVHLTSPGFFSVGETLDYGETVKNLNITIHVESGIYYEHLPIRIPPNVTITGDDFRRTIIRPNTSGTGISQSPWRNIFFYRDGVIDAMQIGPINFNGTDYAATANTSITLSGTSGSITATLGGSSQTLASWVGLVLAEAVYTVTSATVNTNTNIVTMQFVSMPGQSTITEAPYIAGNTINISGMSPTSYNGLYTVLTCTQSSGTATVTFYNYNVSSNATSYGNINIGRAVVNTVSGNILTCSTIFPFQATSFTSGNWHLFNTINYGRHYLTNPLDSSSVPLHNKEMDVFLCNDSTRISQLTIQGHGGFAMVLDPEGQIKTKSPYAQDGASFSRSKNTQTFSGGQFVDGFTGRLFGNIINVQNNGITLTIQGTTNSGLDVRAPQTPCAFYLQGFRYQVNNVVSYDSSTATVVITLDVGTPFNPGSLYNSSAFSSMLNRIIDAWANDAVFGTNYHTVKMGLTYLAPQNAIDATSQLFVTQGINYAENMFGTLPLSSGTQTSLNRSLGTILSIIQNGSTAVPAVTWTDPTGVSANVSNARKILTANRTFIQSEIAAWISSNYSTTSILGYNAVKSQRDIGIIVDALSADLLYGGNSSIYDIASLFYSNGTSVLGSNAEVCLASFVKLNTIIQQIVQNQSISISAGNLQLQDTTSYSAATSSEATTLGNLISLLVDYVSDGVFNDQVVATLTANSTSVTFLSYSPYLTNGVTVTGTGIPAGTTISISSPFNGTGTLSNPVSSSYIQPVVGGSNKDGAILTIVGAPSVVRTPGTITTQSSTLIADYYLFTSNKNATLTATYASGGANGASSLVVSSAIGIVAGMSISGTGIQSGTYVSYTYISGNTTIPLTKTLNAQASGTYTFNSTSLDVLDSTITYNAAGANIGINIEMAGNKSMLFSHFTQVNDLGYGVLVTNGAAVEIVSGFTYYNYVSYWALNGGQIRTVSGSSSYGIYGLRSSGSDVTELPNSVNLTNDMVQVARIYKQGVYAASQSTATNQNLTVYILNYEYVPYNLCEIEIDHSAQGGSITRYSVNTVTHTTVYVNTQNVLALSLSTSGSNNTSTSGLAYNLYDGQLITIRAMSNMKFYNISNVKPVRPSTALQYSSNLGGIYRIIAYNLVESTGEQFLTATGAIDNHSAILSTDTAFAYYSFTVDTASVRNADLINYNAKGTVVYGGAGNSTSSTTLTVNGITGTIVAGYTVGGIGFTNQTVLSVSGPVGGVYTVTLSAVPSLTPTGPVVFSAQTQGATLSDSKIAVLPITSATVINQVNQGFYLTAWGGKVFRVLSYTDATSPASGIYSSGAGTTLNLTSVSGVISIGQIVSGNGFNGTQYISSFTTSTTSGLTTATIILSNAPVSTPSGTITLGKTTNAFLTIDPNSVYNLSSSGIPAGAMTFSSVAYQPNSTVSRFVTYNIPYSPSANLPPVDSYLTVSGNTNSNYNGSYQVVGLTDKTQITVNSTANLNVGMIVTNISTSVSITSIQASTPSAGYFTVNFGTQASVPFATGSTIVIAGVTTTTGYNGNWTVDTGGLSSVVIASSQTGTAVVTNATISTPFANVPGTGGSAYTIIQSIDNSTQFTVSPACWVQSGAIISSSLIATVASVTINNGGSGYTSPPQITFSGGNATSQAIAVATITAGSISSITIVSPGYGYTSVPVVSATAPPAGGNVPTLTAVITQTATVQTTATAGSNTVQATLLYPTDPGTAGNATVVSTAGTSSLATSTINSSGVLTVGTLSSGTVAVGQILTGAGIAQLQNIALTSATASGGTATIGYSAQSVNPFAVGQRITVAGVTPNAFNGTWIVTASSTTQVQFALAGSYTGSAFGTVKSSTYTYISANISGSGTGSTWQTVTSSGSNYAVSSTTITGTGTSSVMLSNMSNISVGNYIIFTTPTGGSQLGNLVSGTTYYITSVNTNTNQITISTSLSGSTFVPGTAIGNMTYYTPSFGFGANITTTGSSKLYSGGVYSVTYTFGATTAPATSAYYYVSGNNNSLYNGYFYCTASSTTSITLTYPFDPGIFGSGTTTVTPEITNGSANTLGVSKPFSYGSNSIPATLRLGYPANSNGQITVKISTNRATSHDFLNTGTGGYNTSNYPTQIYGEAVLAENSSQQVLEETVGRVFYVSTDENGIFRVGRFFQVDQGTGAVTFSASIALSNLDGLGFKRGVVVGEFSTDGSMAQNATDVVPVQSAIRSYIDARLGLTHNGAPTPLINLIGPGYVALDGSLAMKGNLNTSGYTVTGLPLPTYGADASNKQYVDNNIANYNAISKMTDVLITSPSNGQYLIYDSTSSKWKNISSPSGDVNITYSGGVLTTAIQSGVIVNSQINASAAIAQSKLALQAASTATTPPVSYVQSNLGLAVFNGNVFTTTYGYVDLLTSTSSTTGVQLSKIQQISAGTLLGNLTGSAASPTTVSASQVATAAGSILNASFTASGIMTVSYNGSNPSGNTYSVTPVSISNAISSIVQSGSDRSVDVGSLKVSGYTALSVTSTTLGFTTPGGFNFINAVGTSGSNTAITTYGTLDTSNGTLKATQLTTGATATTGSITGNWQVQAGSKIDLYTYGGTLLTSTLSTGAAGNTGTILGTWSLSGASQLQATYADLAEYYKSDQEYEPGTVVVFGGEAEVTTTVLVGDTRAAGVVTTNPAYIMNSDLEGMKVCIALAGRVPVKVVGRVKKGDMLTTSATPGYAVKAIDPKLGSIIGKALEDKNYGEAGVIEVAVGRV